jgi:hypothetical protein
MIRLIGAAGLIIARGAVALVSVATSGRARPFCINPVGRNS